MRVGDTHGRHRANESEGLVGRRGLVVVERTLKDHGVKRPRVDTVAVG